MPTAVQSTKSLDKLLKAILVFSRSVQHVLETQAVESAAGEPLSASKVQILRLLAQSGGHTATQVGRYLGVSKPAVTQLIDSMVRAKLVNRLSAKTDRREVNLHLTEQGRRLAREVNKQQRHLVRAALRDARVGSADNLAENLQNIAAHLAQANSEVEHYCLQCGAFEDRTCVLVGGHAHCPLEGEEVPANGRTKRTARTKGRR
ncbi:MAG: MarR family transcriptional regulator [Phycisphaerae bacterium]|nr:MarR family transcriptional regulator [Phycisphaerae bacterium]